MYEYSRRTSRIFAAIVAIGDDMDMIAVVSLPVASAVPMSRPSRDPGLIE